MAEIVAGVDVSVRRGLDVVVLEGSNVVDARSFLDAEGLHDVLLRQRPAAVAIDSPPGPGREPGSGSRPCERALHALGVSIFSTPTDADRFAKPFYDWIRVGMQAYASAESAGYPVQDDPAVVRDHALEVFPHASDVFLRGCRPPLGTTRRVGMKLQWRLATLRTQGIDEARLCTNRRGVPTMDSIDAALAALTAGRALAGAFGALGDDGAWIVVPGRRREPFVRCSPDR